MTTAGERGRVTIIGAGPAGATMAIYLGRRGYTVRVYERREDIREADPDDGRRSINLGLSLRGIRTLEDVGVKERVMAGAVPARGRVIHPVRGETRFQPYGRKSDEILWSISRRDLNCALIDRAEAMENVTFWFRHQCTRFDKATGATVFLDTTTGKSYDVEADFVVGADGAFSVVRQQMQRGERADFVQEWLPWGYKEMRLPAGEDGKSRIFLEALHVWPRGDCVIVSHPNQDGSHTCTLFLPHEGGPRSFAALKDDRAVLEFFRETFPDVVDLVPDLAAQWRHHPEASLVATRTSMWHYGDRVVAVGDACHAVYPFYGQGMNAAMEDCLTLDRCLERHGDDRAAAFAEYQRTRKENTDALHELICRNFVELREGAASPVFVWNKKVDFVLNTLFPERWLPPYTMVVHTTMPYAEALRRADRQARIRRRLGIDFLVWLALPFDALRRRLGGRGGAATPAPSPSRGTLGAAGSSVVTVSVQQPPAPGRAEPAFATPAARADEG
ncbi:MAG TPA: NAD(P)/FAD-dependent oxidoreductase [Longimicrobium sp.]|nr:NAD(P)/FAD-dependent oxidoreductase [Longimicrobium sp.]